MTILGSNVIKAGNLTATYHTCDGTSVAVGSDITIEGISTISGVSINSGNAVLSSGASYYLEISLAIYNYNTSATVQWYNQTTSTYVGQETVLKVSPAYQTRVNRLVARCLILSSDFGSNSTMTLSARTTSKVGNALYEVAGYTEPHVRIIRIT